MTLGALPLPGVGKQSSHHAFSGQGSMTCSIGNIILMKVTALVHHGWSITYSKRLKTQQTYCDLPRPRGRGEREREYERERDRPARKER